MSFKYYKNEFNLWFEKGEKSMNNSIKALKSVFFFFLPKWDQRDNCV